MTWILSSLMLAMSPAAAESEGVLELTVTPQPFARFDHTRWRVDTQIGVPYPAVMYALYNDEVQFVSLDLRMVVGCDLDGVAVRGRQEVTCVVEDAALSLVPWLKRLPPGADRVVQDADDILTGLRVQLQVAEDGRILDVGLLDEPQTNRRINRQYENIRQAVMRAMLGFHMALPDRFTTGEEWVERNSRLFTLPVFRYSTPSSGLAGDTVAPDERMASTGSASQDAVSGLTSGLPSSGPSVVGGFEEVRTSPVARFPVHPMELWMAPAGIGRSVVVNRMDVWKGQYVVQGVGEGTVNMGADVPMVFRGDLKTIAVYDPARGYMTERRWTVEMAPTASSPLANCGAGWPYWQIGSLYLLGADEESAVGESKVLERIDKPRGQLSL